MDFSNRCRGCLSNSEESLRPLNDSQVLELFQECVRISVSLRPSFPKNICNSCYGKCLTWKKFQQQCHETDILLNFKLHNDEKQQNNKNLPDTKSAVDSNEKHQILECLFDNEIPIQTNSRLIEDQQEETQHCLQREIEVEFEIEDYVQDKDTENEIQVHETTLSTLETNELTKCKQIVIENTTAEVVYALEPESAKHESVNLYCKQCLMRFRSSDRYQAHLRHHQGLKPEVCKICNQEFSTSRALRSHMLRHTNNKKYSCIDCGRTYKYSTSLTLHRKSHNDVARFVCDLCGKSFIRAHGLKSHLISHSTDTPFECSQCQKRFKNEIMLRNHVLRRHDQMKNFSCPNCEKSFTTGAELRIHTRSHTNQKPYKCSQCDKCYKTRSHLTVHFRAAHTTERPYSCDLCEQSFAHSKVLKQHRLIHTSERPYACPICQRTFRQNSTLYGHLKSHKLAESINILPETN
ncbi:zinc finger protein 180-like [Sabethes cyaneus]|uniref:zinc finger protein 180-like n=1 Tax=Sabethes cyaneus TaxID=53552 RepID=UPI00237D5CAF|nr:zinc finger protein 180-like [Sabethes cyaneus]